jgi:hypothetical protein
MPEREKRHMIRRNAGGGGRGRFSMPELSKCNNCLLYGKECHPTPEQLAQDRRECPYYDPVDAADRLAQEIRLFGAVPGKPKGDGNG